MEGMQTEHGLDFCTCNDTEIDFPLFERNMKSRDLKYGIQYVGPRIQSLRSRFYGRALGTFLFFSRELNLDMILKEVGSRYLLLQMNLRIIVTRKRAPVIDLLC